MLILPLYRLGDPDDDVRSVAATCLIPVVRQLVDQLPESLNDMLIVLWNCLSDMKDDLGTSVSAVMDLIGKFLCCCRVYLIITFHFRLLGKLVTYEQVTQLLASPSSP
jgi:hypothetical protein